MAQNLYSMITIKILWKTTPFSCKEHIPSSNNVEMAICLRFQKKEMFCKEYKLHNCLLIVYKFNTGFYPFGRISGLISSDVLVNVQKLGDSVYSANLSLWPCNSTEIV